jgi:hypothetical protein
MRDPAREDRGDALVLTDSLRTDMRTFRATKPESPWILELREYSRRHEDFVQERTRNVRLAPKLRSIACSEFVGERVR